MGFLVSLLPGVRDLRAPFVSGLLWLATVYFGIPTAFSRFASDPSVAAASSLFSSLGVLAVSVTAAAGLLAGMVIRGLVEPVTRLFGRRLLRAARWLGSKEVKISSDGRRAPSRRPYWFYKLIRYATPSWPFDSVARNLLIDHIQSKLSKVKVPGAASIMLPIDALIRNLQFSAPQLAVTAPTQYQEYDRLKSEVELRVLIAPALIALSIVLPLGPRWVTILVATLIALVLWAQASGSSLAANNLLANAVYLDLVKLPTLEALSSALSEVDDPPASVGGWLAEMNLVFQKLGMFDEAEELLMETSTLERKDNEDALSRFEEDSYEYRKLTDLINGHQAWSSQRRGFSWSRVANALPTSVDGLDTASQEGEASIEDSAGAKPDR